MVQNFLQGVLSEEGYWECLLKEGEEELCEVRKADSLIERKMY